MTDKTALRQLIESCEAGKIYLPDSERWEALTMSGYLPNKAFYGSLDAAKALHAALLPGWAREIWSAQDEDADAKVYPPLATGQEFTGRTEGIDLFSAEVDGDNPARAWLIAILKAYEAQQ